MRKSGVILPRINDKQILEQNSIQAKSRKEIVEEKIRRRRNELRIVCPAENESRNILDIERKAMGALVNWPLVDWQINNNKSNNSPDEALRLQQAKVEDWLVRNHFQVTRLPRLDPIVLTSRGADFSKYTNFVFPAPYCLRFKSKPNRHQKCSYEESVQGIRERCPRLLRTQRDNRDLFNLNPVVRVGGGYRRLSWKTAEVLPSIGQTEKDVTSEFTCMACGMNLAVTQQIADIENSNRFVVTYPNICANCGTPVNRRPKKVRNGSSVVLPPIEAAKYEHRDFDHNWRRHRTTGNPIEGEEENQSENDTGYSFTPEDSVFITEADGSITCLISKKPRDEYPHDNIMSRENHHSTEGMDTIEHTDLKSGMRVRVSKRSSKVKRDIEKSADDNGNDNGSHKDGGELGTKQVFYHEEALGALSSDLDGASVYGKRSRGMTSHYRKPKRFYSVYYQERYAQSDSELQIPYNRHILERHVTRRRSAFEEVQQDMEKSGCHLYGDERSGDSVGEWGRQNTSSSLQVGNIGRSESLDDIRKCDKSRSRNTKRRSQSAQEQKPSTKQRNLRKSRKNENKREKNCEKHRTQSGTLQNGSEKLRNNSRQKLNSQLEESDDGYAHDCPDGYTADSEEESLLKLQARLDQFKKMTRKKSSGKRTSTNEKGYSSPRKQPLDLDKEKTKLLTSGKKAKASLASYGLDSDSWNSEDSLHVRPISNDYSTSDEEFPKYGKARSFSFDISDLPSYRKMAGFYELLPLQRALTFYKRGGYSRDKTALDLSRAGREEGEDDTTFDIEKIDDGKFIGYQPVKQKYTSRKKYPRKVYKTVPLAKTNGRFQFHSKLDDDDLTESDVTLLTAQLQNSFNVNLNKTSNSVDLICKGQSCFRCGTFVDECEAICTMCGTHCKQLPCNVCRDICERCGRAKVRCKSREHLHGNETTEPEEMEDEGIGLFIGCINEEENDYCFGSETVSPDASFSFEESSAIALPAKKSRKPIKKKQKMGSSRGKQLNRQRTSTFDSIETVLEEVSTIGVSDAEELIGDGVIQDKSLDEISDFTVAKPQKSQYTKSKKKFKSSRQVVSQTVVYKNITNESLSRGTSFDEANEEFTDENRSHGIESEDVETQAVAQEEPLQKTQDVEAKKSNKAAQIKAEGTNDPVKDNDEKVVEKDKKNEQGVQKEILKTQIPKPKLRGVQRVNAAYKERVDLNRRLQAMLKEALSKVIAEADVRVRRDSTVDYLSQYRLVDRSKVEVYGRAFALEDEAEKGIISYEQMLLALEGVPTIQGMSRQQLNYVLQVLEINTFSRTTFKMFAVITALCEKVTSLDPFVRDIIEGIDLTETEWKLDLYKNMFYVAGDRSVTFISPGNLRIELKAGGLNQQQEDHVIKHITQSARNGQISFLDYMAYLPLFLSIHQNICSNALDMSLDKYTRRKVKAMA